MQICINRLILRLILLQYYKVMHQSQESAYQDQTHPKFQLSTDQHAYIQNLLPKQYSLIEVKEAKKMIKNKMINEESVQAVEAQVVHQRQSTDSENKSQRSKEKHHRRVIQEQEEEQGVINAEEVDAKVKEESVEELDAKEETPQRQEEDVVIETESEGKMVQEIKHKSKEKKMKKKKTKEFNHRLRKQSRKKNSNSKYIHSQEYQVIQRLKEHDYIDPFLKPVDEERDGAPGYYRVITKPMDLETIETKLLDGKYQDTDDFDQDIELIFANSFKFNRKNNCMITATQVIQKLYHKLTNKQAPKKEAANKRGRKK